MMTLDELNRCPIADNTPGGVLVEVRRSDVSELIGEIERLRALIKAAERSGECDECPWCGGVIVGPSAHHQTCPAFTPEGTVK